MNQKSPQSIHKPHSAPNVAPDYTGDMRERRYDPTDRSLKERVFHALLFEIIGVLTSAPLFAFLLNRPLLEMGVMTLIIATTAVIWNFFYNLMFDRFTRSWIQARGFWVRAVHALLFELGLIFITVPLIAFLLSITMHEVFFMEIGILLYFLPYTIVFNWGYDAVRKRLWLSRQSF